MNLGPYTILDELGRGGMGRVFRARDEAGRELAVKVLRSTSAEALGRFDRERRLLAGLGAAAGFVPLVDAGLSQQAGPWIAMPLLGGGTLADRIDRDGALGDEVVARLGIALATALARAHERGIVHRDLKPENVLFDERGKPLIADLGLAKHFVEQGTFCPSLSRTGEFRGTVVYAAPEQIKDAKSAGPPMDVWALGAVLFEAATGRPLFSGDGPLAVMTGILRDRPPTLRSVRPDAPAWLDRVIDEALSREPEHRPSATALAERLQAGLAGELHELSSAGAVRVRAASRAARRTVIAALAGTLVAFGAGVGAAALFGAFGAPDPATPLAKVPPAPPPAPVWPLPAGPGPDEPDVAVPPPYDRIVVPDGLRLVEVRGRPGWGHPGEVVSRLAWAEQGRVVLSACGRGAVVAWDLATGAERGRERDDALVAFALEPDGRSVLIADTEGRIRRAPVPGGEPGAAPFEPLDVKAHENAIMTFTVTPDGALAVSGATDGEIVAIDLRAGGARRVLRAGGDESRRVHGLVCTANGRLVVVDRKAVTSIDIATGRPLPGELVLWEGEERPDRMWAARLLALDANGERVLVTTYEKDVAVVNVAAGEIVARFGPLDRSGAPRAGSRPVASLALTPDRSRILLGCNDGAVEVWDAKTLAPTGRLDGHVAAVTALAVAPNGRTLATASAYGLVRTWDLPTLAPAPADRDRTPLLHLATDALGHVVAYGGDDGAVLVHSAVDGRRGAPRRLEGSSRSSVRSVGVSLDGSRIIAGRHDGTVDIWEADTGERLAATPAHAGPVYASRLSPDGRRAVTTSIEEPRLVHWRLGARGGRARPEPLAGLPFAYDGWIGAAADSLLLGLSDGTVREARLLPGGGARLVEEPTTALRSKQSRIWLRATPSDGSSFPLIQLAGVDAVGRMVVSADGLFRVTAHFDGRVLAAQNDHKAVAVLAKDDDFIGNVALGATDQPSRPTIACCSANGIVRVWPETPDLGVERIVDFAPSGDRPANLAVIDGGRTLLVGTFGGVVLRFEIERH